MKKPLYLGSAAAFVASLGLIGGQTYAAHAPASMTPVRLCVSAPIGIPSNQHLVQGIYNGAALATSQWKAKFKKVGLNLENQLNKDYARSDGSGNDPNKERQNALDCINNKAVMGYVGTLNSSIALVSEPILNKASMVMVSPSNTGVVLTDPKSRQAQEPYTYSHKLPFVTYYRTVTTDALQGPADAVVVGKKLGAKTYYLVDDKQTYGAGLAQAMDAYAQNTMHLTRVGSGHIDPTDSSSIATSADAVSDQIVQKNPDAVFYGGNLETGYTLAKDMRQKGYTKPLVGGDAISDPRWIPNSGAGAANDYCTSVGPDPSLAAKSFVSAYHKKFKGFQIGPYDATSYDSASVILSAIYTAKKAGKLKGSITFQRRTVVFYVRHIHFKGATGVTSFDNNGDTTNRIISVYKVSGSNWAYIGIAPKVPGAKPTG